MSNKGLVIKQNVENIANAIRGKQGLTGRNQIDLLNPNIKNPSNLTSISFEDDILSISSSATNTTPFVGYTLNNIKLNDIIRFNCVILSTKGQIVVQYYRNNTWTSVGEYTKRYTDGTSISSITVIAESGVSAIRFLLYSDYDIPTGNSLSKYKNIIATINNTDMRYEPYCRYKISKMDEEINKLPSIPAVSNLNVIGTTQESTSLTITDGKEAQINKIDVLGRTEQKTTTGKNKILVDTFTDGTYTKTVNGVTATINNDGSILVRGTATGGRALIDITVHNPNLNTGAAYFWTNAPNTNFRIEIACVIDGVNKYLNSYSTPNVFQITNTFTLNGIYIVVSEGTTVNDTLFAMIGNGTFDSYEPYTGGPSPNPDYPSPIENVRGKNLLNKSNYTTIDGRLAFDISNLVIGEEYVFSSNLDVTAFKISIQYNSYSSVEKNDVTGFTQFTFTMARHPNISEGAKQYLFFKVGTAWVTNITELNGYNLQIEEGTEATPYTPYNTINFSVEGKNKFNIYNLNNYAKQKVTYFQDGNGFTLNDTELYRNGAQIGLLKELCPELKVGDSFKFNFETNAIRTSSGFTNPVTYFYLYQGANILIYKNTIYIATQDMLNSLVFLYSGGTENCYYKDITFVKSTDSFTPYEPYHTPQTVSFPLGEKVLMQGSKLTDYGFYDERGQTIFDGSENWENYVEVGTTIQIRLIKNFKNREGYSNNFIVASNYNDNEHMVIGGGLDACFIHINKTRLSTKDVAGFKTWLSTHPTTLEYELATPTITPYTAEQQTAYNQLKALLLHTGTNYITTDGNLPPNMKIEYKQDGLLVVREEM